MNKLAILSAAFLFIGCADDLEQTEQASTGEQGMHGAPEPHLQYAKDAKPGGQASGSPLMTNHGGEVITPVSKTMAVFWGSAWSTNPTFAADKVAGLDSFFTGFNQSAFATTATEYNGTNTLYVTADSQYLGHVFDGTEPPAHKALSTSQAIAEACKITNQSPDPQAIYFLYTSTTAGHASYCAWHSWGNCSNGAPVQVAYMPNIDGLSGCDPQDTSGRHSQGLAALANVTSHELMEAITDPRGKTWYDSSGQENGDKCAWSFDHDVTFSDGSVWKLQMEWSNEAYTAGTGLPNRSGQKGCLQD